MPAVDVERLAELARIHTTPEERKKLEKDFESILAYVSKMEEAKIKYDSHNEIANLWGRTNVFRDDGESHIAGKYSAELLAEAPSVERGFVKVKKIL